MKNILFFFRNNFLNASLFKKLFLITIILEFLIMPLLSLKGGINGDERFQIYITKHILDFYTSFGKNRDVLRTEDDYKVLAEKYGKEKLSEMGVEWVPANDLKYYGGFFEFFSALVGKIIGHSDEYDLTFHTVRHILLAIIGAFIILFTSLIVRELTNWRGAWITALITFVCPRFLGQSFMNPKDLPFALGYVIAGYYMIRFFRQLPTPPKGTMAGLITGIAIALNMRVGGLLLLAYLGLFLILYLAKKVYLSKQKLSTQSKAIKKTVIVGVLGYFGGCIFWPYALLNPLTNPLKAMQFFSTSTATIRQLFEGQEVFSRQLPWYYLFKYLVISNPVVLVFGFCAAVVLIIIKRKKIDLPAYGIPVFLFAFPLAYIVYKHANVYSGWRHILFIFPMMGAIAGAGWELIYSSLKKRVMVVVVSIALAVSIAFPLYSIARLHPYEYVYFNRLVGGVDNAWDDYVTDYWMISVREAVEWLAENENLKDVDHKVVVATNCIYPAKIYLNNVSENIDPKYVRYYERTESDWDYGIFYNDHVSPEQLKNKLWPPDGTIYTVYAGKAPLCAVVKRTDKSDYYGQQALKENKYDEAIKYFLTAKKSYPNTAAIYTGLGRAYLGLNQAENAVSSLKKAINLNPGDPAGYFMLGTAYAYTGNTNYAIFYLNKTIGMSPGYRPAYKLLGDIYSQMGDKNKAQQYYNAVNQLK